MSLASISRATAPLLASLFLSIIGWIIIAPISAIVPRRRDWIAVIGRQGGQFTDNAKYFFLQAARHAPTARLAFVTEHRHVEQLFSGTGFESIHYPGIKGAWFLMRCGSVVADESGWYRGWRYFFTIRARTIQLWHGAGFKRIELDLWRNEAGNFAWASHPMILALRLLSYRITGRRNRYAAVAASSRFYRDQTFIPSFRSLEFPVCGLPRNDFAKSLSSSANELAWRNVDPAVTDQLGTWKRSGRKLVLVAPTFRRAGNLPMQLDKNAIALMGEAAADNQLEFIFKFHPAERNIDFINGDNFHILDRQSDVYPLLPHVDALITDYSSIATDFVLLDRPVLFHADDDHQHIRNEPGLQFDPVSMMPGPIKSDWKSLLAALLSQLQEDTYQEDRASVRSKAFDDLPQSEATSTLIDLMRHKQWLQDSVENPPR